MNLNFARLGQHARGYEVPRLGWTCGALAAFTLLVVTGGCTKSNKDQRDVPGLSRVEMKSRSAAIIAAYTARVEAVAANPTSAGARGALATFLHANDYLEEAAAQYEQLRLSDSAEARWSYHLARIRQDEGRSEAARALLEEAAARAPSYALIGLRQADLLLKSGESTLAEAGYRSYLTRVPSSAHARLGLARIAMQKQDWPAAELLLLEALRQEPEFPGGRALLVSVLEARGESDKAARARASAGIRPRHGEPVDPWIDELMDHCFDVDKLSVLADIAFETGRTKRGVDLLERSRQIDPTRARTHLELAKAKLKTEGRAAALPLLKTATRLDPSLADAHYLLAGELYAAGDLAAALSGSELALRANSQNAGLHRQRGTLLQARGRHADAQAAFERAVSLDPTDVTNVETLGNFHWANDHKESAVAQFERARALSRLAVKPRAILGSYYLDTGRLPEAERCIAEAFEIEPTLDGLDDLRALLHVRRGNGFFRAGDPLRAEAEYRAALAAKAVHEESLTNLVAVWLRTGRASEARERLSAFMAEHPRATFVYALGGRVLAQTGDRAAALELVGRGLDVAREQKDGRQEQVLRKLQEQLRAP